MTSPSEAVDDRSTADVPGQAADEAPRLVLIDAEDAATCSLDGTCW